MLWSNTLLQREDEVRHFIVDMMLWSNTFCRQDIWSDTLLQTRCCGPNTLLLTRCDQTLYCRQDVVEHYIVDKMWSDILLQTRCCDQTLYFGEYGEELILYFEDVLGFQLATQTSARSFFPFSPIFLWPVGLSHIPYHSLVAC